MKAQRKTDFIGPYGSASREPGQTQPLARTLSDLMGELRSGLDLYWKTAEKVLAGSGIELKAPTDGSFSLERNFFSTLFLYSYGRAAIPLERRIVYVAANQCLRGIVTGCDNILDDEYKMTLDTDLPAEATRFRSILDIMVSDRVLFELLADLCRTHRISFTELKAASSASLCSLAKSGAEEASEEGGVFELLSSEAILSRVHHFKTGMLFQSTWAIPAAIEGGTSEEASAMESALYKIGMGCQIFDDMVDLLRDVGMKRHNYVEALVRERSGTAEWERLQELVAEGGREARAVEFYERQPLIRELAGKRALAFLKAGLADLFSDDLAFLVDHAIRFISDRIGVDHACGRVD